jgi:hypothetical protein
MSTAQSLAFTVHQMIIIVLLAQGKIGRPEFTRRKPNLQYISQTAQWKKN